MKLIKTITELTEEFKRLMIDYNEYLWSIAWADFNFVLSDLLVKKQKRIKKLCVGLQFFGTDSELSQKIQKYLTALIGAWLLEVM